MAEAACVTLIERFSIARLTAAAIVSAGAFVVGTLVVLSYNVWSGVLLFSHWTIQQVVQGVAANILTPLAALLIAIFAGWVVRRQITSNELNFKPVFYNGWRFLIRFLAPAAIVVIGLVMLVS
jgi:NSS family neurotransmitter:Na+ symporter